MREYQTISYQLMPLLSSNKLPTKCRWLVCAAHIPDLDKRQLLYKPTVRVSERSLPQDQSVSVIPARAASLQTEAIHRPPAESSGRSFLVCSSWICRSFRLFSLRAAVALAIQIPPPHSPQAALSLMNHSLEQQPWRTCWIIQRALDIVTMKASRSKEKCDEGRASLLKAFLLSI